MAMSSALVFNVSTLLTEPLGSVREYAVRRAAFRAGEGRTPVTGEARFTRTDSGVLVEARLALEVEEICGRCLEPFGQALALEVEEEFWPDFDPLHPERPAAAAGNDGFPVVEGLLDLQEALRQYVEMARPMRAICRSDCPGPGSAELDRAEAPTVARDALAEPPADDRWAALAELRDKLG